MEQQKISLRQAVIVEGKYDKMKLESLVDGLILTTEGFRIFRDREMRAFLQRLAREDGIVVLTDSDAAGFRIRAHIKNICSGGSVTHIYIPDIYGKERRKTRPGAENKLGVEGLSTKLLRECFRQAGLCESDAAPTHAITKLDLYEAGLSGGAGSRGMREAMCRELQLPQRLSANELAAAISRRLTREAFFQLARQLRERQQHGAKEA